MSSKIAQGQCGGERKNLPTKYTLRKMLKLHPITIQTNLKQAKAGKRFMAEYLTNLETAFDRIEPKIHAFISEPERFQRLHKEIDIQKPEGNQPLRGLLVAVKDIFQVDGFATQAGSQLPSVLLAGPEADCITALRKLGALILGKTVTTEFAYFAPGATRNPHNPYHTPGGSSSGSAAAVAAGLAPLAFGTQTIGSIIRPASYCGVIGFKPSYGRISTQGVIPLAPSVDTVGYFTADLAGTSTIAPFLLSGWKDVPANIKQPVLGIPSGPYLEMADPEMIAHYRETCVNLQHAGYQVLEIPLMPDFETIACYHNQIVAYEAAKIHRSWFQEFSGRYHIKTAELIKRGQTIPVKDYQRALDSISILRHTLSKRMKSEGIDLWLSPSAQGSAPKGLESTGSPILNLPWTHCGYPTINLPSGFDKTGLPFGLQVTAGWNRDEALLKWCSKLQVSIHQ
jgi:Asp-tRNA(Asn)/Glu-tRNA(Gln) amidotransferase A subunit family amidase